MTDNSLEVNIDFLSYSKITGGIASRQKHPSILYSGLFVNVLHAFQWFFLIFDFITIKRRESQKLFNKSNFLSFTRIKGN